MSNINSLKNTVTFSGADIEVWASKTHKTDEEKRVAETNKKKIEELNIENQVLAETEIVGSPQQLAHQYSSTIPGDKAAGFGSVTSRYGIAPVSSIPSKEAEKQEENRRRIDELSKVNEDIEEPRLFHLGNLHTISYSSFREKFAVRTLGRTHARSYCRGPRTTAGTMIFNVVQEHDILSFVNHSLLDRDTDSMANAVMLDQIHPFDLVLMFMNEYGAYSYLRLFNVDIASEGQEMSIDNLVTHNTMNFYATDMIPMTDLGNNFYSYTDMGTDRIVKELVKGGQPAERRRPMPIKIESQILDLLKEDNYNKILASSRGLF